MAEGSDPSAPKRSGRKPAVAAPPARKSAPAKRRPKGPTTPDPIEIAMEALASNGETDSPAHRLLVQQERLVRWQIAQDQAGFALKVLTVLVGLLAVLVVGLMVWQARSANGVLIQPFSVPPELAERGLTGEVLAAQVLDELARVDGETTTIFEARRFSGAWGQELRVEIPSTGVSLEELQAALRRWLGRELQISGEVYRTTDWVVVGARIAGSPVIKVEGPEPSLDGHVQIAARSLYRQISPQRYAAWLVRRGDRAAAIEALQQLIPTAATEAERIALRAQLQAVELSQEAAQEASPAVAQALIQAATEVLRQRLRRASTAEERGSLMGHMTSYATGEPRMLAALAHEAVQLNPRDGPAWIQVATFEDRLGHSEAAYAARLRAARAVQGESRWAAGARDANKQLAQVSQDRGHILEALGHVAAAERNPFAVRFEGVALDNAAIVLMAQAHDIEAARARLAAPRHLGHRSALDDQGQLRNLGLRILFESEEYPALLIAQDEAAVNPAPTSFYWIARAAALTRVGRLAEAQVVVERMPPDCDRCLVARGKLAAARGQVAESERWFARAAELTPSLPQARLEWGRTRLQRGDLKGAIEQFREAERRGPGWADPLKYEGDALARKGELRAAVRRYQRAAKLAPRWGGLHLAWGEALARQGQAEAGRREGRIAQSLYLTDEERIRLARLLSPPVAA
jgi:tetratricopeptide (TPR) repeat protein